MQVYLNQTVLPLLATEMGTRNAYGLVTAAAQVPAFPPGRGHAHPLASRSVDDGADHFAGVRRRRRT